MELENARATSESELEKRDALIRRLREEVTNKEEELEFVKDELKEKADELEEANADLEIKEASFNNSFRVRTREHMAGQSQRVKL